MNSVLLPLSFSMLAVAQACGFDGSDFSFSLLDVGCALLMLLRLTNIHLIKFTRR